MIMWSHPHTVIVFALYLTACQCGVIDETYPGRCQAREKREAKGMAEGAVKYGSKPEVGVGVSGGSPPVHDLDVAAAGSLELPSVKQKRCPSTQPRLSSRYKSNSNQILGVKTPLAIQRRDIQSDMTKRFCITCKASAQCKLYNKCDHCRRWCTEEDLPTSNTTDNIPSSTPETNNTPQAPTSNGDLSSEESDEVQMTLPNRLGGTSMEDQDTEDTRLALPTPGGFKRIFTIANFSSGPLKELICNLLGISDTADIDKMVVWVTTFSNQPPRFAQGYKKNVSPKAEKLTDALNEELKKTMDQNKKQGRNYLTNEEMEDMAKKILLEQQGDASMIGKSSEAGSRSSEQLSPAYPADHDNLPHKVNPDVTEDTLDPKLVKDSREYKFPTSPKIGSVKEESIDTSGDKMVGNSVAEKEDTLKQVQSASVQDTSSPNLSNREDIGDEDPSIIKTGKNRLETDKIETEGLKSLTDKSDSTTPATIPLESGNENEIQTTADKKEPSKLVTKKLMQQVKELMKQRATYSGRYHQDNAIKPEDFKLGNIQQSSTNDKLSDSENLENIEPSLQSSQTPGDETQDHVTDPTAIKEGSGAADQSVFKEIQDMQPAMSDSKPKTSVVTSPYLEDGRLKSEDPNFKSMKTITATTNLQDDLSESILQKSKSEIQNIVNDFDTAKAMLKNVENIVEEIKKQTNMEPVKEQAAIGDDVKSSLSPSDSVNTANVPDLRLPESVGSTSEVTDKKRPESILDRILKKKLHGKDKLGQPKLKPDKLGDEKVGSQPIERVIWDKQMDPRMFQHASQRKGKDKLRLGSPRTDDIVTSEVEENGTPSGLNHDFPAKFPGQKVTVRGKEIPLKQKTTMEMSPHAGTEDAVGDVPSKLKPEEKDSTSTYQEALDLGKAPSQVAVDDAYLETNDKNPEKMDSRLKNIDALGSSKDPSQIIAGSASKYYDDISEGMDNKLRNNEPFGLRKTSFHKIADTASKYDNIPEGIDSRSSNKEPLGLNKIPSQETVGDVFPVNNDNSPKEMHSGLKDIDTLSQNKDLWHAVVGSASKYNDNIREEMDSRSRINEALGSSKALALPRPDEFPVVGNALEESRWSSSLGTLMPVKPDHSSAPVSPKDMYFVGTGIKLPLQMIRNDNGTVHLSVDLDKLCSCKNNTVCPKNHTAVEETVGTALEKQINAENNLDNADFGNVPVGMSLQNPKEESQKISSPSTTRRNERGTRSKWLDMKNSIARQLDPIEQDIQREDINIFKRSTEKNAVNETPPEKISVSTHVDKEHEENSIPKNSLLHHVESNSDGDTLDTFQEFLHKKLMTLKTKMMDTERKNELKLHQSEEKFMDTLNAINRKVIPSTRTNEIEDIMARGAKEKLEDKMETMDLNKSLGSMKPIALKSRFMEDPSSKERGNELFDIVIPIKGANKQKKVENLQNNLENLNEYIDRYSTEKKIKQKETDSLQKTNKNSFIKKEVDIVGNVLRFLKSLATDEK